MSTPPILPDRDFDLLGLDRWTLLSRMQTMINRAIPEWDDFSLGYPENVLLEANAILVSTAVAAARENARQMYFPTMTRRLPLMRMARPFGYVLASAEAAQVPGLFSTKSGLPTAKLITIPDGTLLMAGSNLYRLVLPVQITVGSITSAAATLENAELHTIIVASPGDIANWFIEMAYDPYIAESAVVSAANGEYSQHINGSTTVLWRSFLEMGPADRGYIVLVDDQGTGKIVFGNGINGAIPQGDVQVSYKTGGGSAGAVSAGAVWKVISSTMDVDGTPVQLSFANASGSTGGVDQESVEEGRIRAPQALRVMERAVIEPGAEASAEKVAGIAHCACITSEQVSTVPEDEAWIYLVAYGVPYAASGYYPPVTPTAAQVAEVTARFAPGGVTPMVMGIRETVQAAGFFDLNVAVRIYKSVAATGATTALKQAAARAAIETALQQYLAVADADRAPLYTADWGYKLALLGIAGLAEMAWSDIFEVVAGPAEIRKIPEGESSLLLNGSPVSVPVPDLQYVRLGTVLIYDMDEGGMSI